MININIFLFKEDKNNKVSEILFIQFLIKSIYFDFLSVISDNY